MRELFQISKQLSDGQRLPTLFDKRKKTAIRNKIHRKGVCAPKTKQKEGREIAFFYITFRDTILIFSVYFKRSFNEKVGSFTMKQVMGSAFL